MIFKATLCFHSRIFTLWSGLCLYLAFWFRQLVYSLYTFRNCFHLARRCLDLSPFQPTSTLVVSNKALSFIVCQGESHLPLPIGLRCHIYLFFFFPLSTLRTYYSIFFRVCQDGIFKNQKKIFWSNLLPFSKNGIFVRVVAHTTLNFHSYAFNFFRLVKFQVLTTFLRLWERPSANPSVYRNLIFLITNL